jgi:hypothetical protein
VSASLRPFVYPTVRPPWRHEGSDLSGRRFWVQVENGGAGPAINVQGTLHWKGGAGGNSSLVPASLGAGSEAEMNVVGAGIDVNWATAKGHLRYRDLEGN